MVWNRFYAGKYDQRQIKGLGFQTLGFHCDPVTDPPYSMI